MRRALHLLGLVVAVAGLAGVALALSGALDGWLDGWTCSSGRERTSRECWYGEAKLATVQLSGGLLLAGGILAALTSTGSGPGVTIDLRRFRRR